MSSLAGALSYTRDTVSQPDNDDFDTTAQLDVDMEAQAHLDPSENDADSVPGQDQDMHDLFGEDNAAEEIKHEAPASPVSSEHLDGISSPERKHREAMEYAEDDEPEPMVEQVLEATAAIPNIPVPRSSDGNYWVIRMPNFVKVDSKPFHPDTYVGPEHEDEDSQHAETLREKSMTIKLKVENTVRWRWLKDQDGQDQRQSNSRIIRWSDGSLSLKLGKELFDITQTIDTSGAVPRQALGGSQSQSQSQPPSSGSKAQGQGLTYLVAQHKRAEILQCESLITGYMSLRPTGMQSETHRMLVRAVGQKHNKVARLRMAPDPTMDPEREKMELLKQASRKPKRSKGEDDSFNTNRRRRTGHTRKRTGDDMWSDDEDEEGFGGGASEDEYGLGGEGKTKKRKAEEGARKGPGEYQTDDFLVSDSDEEGHDSDHGEGRKRRNRKGREEDGEDDDLEKLEAQIDQREAEERKRRQGEAADGERAAIEDFGGDDAMDVESEEEEEHRVRKAGAASGTRKKRQIEVEEEEED